MTAGSSTANTWLGSALGPRYAVRCGRGWSTTGYQLVVCVSQPDAVLFEAQVGVFQLVEQRVFGRWTAGKLGG